MASQLAGEQEGLEIEDRVHMLQLCSGHPVPEKVIDICRCFQSIDKMKTKHARCTGFFGKILKKENRQQSRDKRTMPEVQEIEQTTQAYRVEATRRTSCILAR